MKKKLLVAVVLCFALVLTACSGTTTPSASGTQSPAPAKDPIVFRLSHSNTTSGPYQQVAQRLADKVAQRTDGRIKIDIYPSSQLGDAQSVLVNVQQGSIDMVVTATSNLSNFDSYFSLFDFPYIFDSLEHADKVLDGEIGKAALERLSSKGFIGLDWAENGFRHLTNAVRPVYSPSDLKGLKIRTMETKVHLDAFRAWGANPTPMAYGELYTALLQGTVDGQENPIAAIYDMKFTEVNKHLSMTGHVYSPLIVVMSKVKWDKLSKEDQQIFLEAAAEAKKEQREWCRSGDEAKLAEMIQKGAQVVTADKIDIAAFRDGMAPVYKQYEKEFGAEIQRILALKP